MNHVYRIFVGLWILESAYVYSQGDKIYELLKSNSNCWPNINLLCTMEHIIFILQKKIELTKSNGYMMYDIKELWEGKRTNKKQHR